MSKQLEITKEYGSNSWGLKGLTLEEFMAVVKEYLTTEKPTMSK